MTKSEKKNSFIIIGIVGVCVISYFIHAFFTTENDIDKISGNIFGVYAIACLVIFVLVIIKALSSQSKPK